MPAVKSTPQPADPQATAKATAASTAVNPKPAPRRRTPAVKPAPRAAAQPSAKAAKRVAAKAPSPSAPVKPAPPVRAAKPAKATKATKAAKAPKLRRKPVRDSFTMPEADFALIATLKARALWAQRETKKSELLRAGLHALAALPSAALLAALEQLEPVKVGRPRKS